MSNTTKPVVKTWVLYDPDRVIAVFDSEMKVCSEFCEEILSSFPEVLDSNRFQFKELYQKKEYIKAVAFAKQFLNTFSMKISGPVVLNYSNFEEE